THPAHPGDFIVIIATGLGAVHPPIANGQAPNADVRTTLATPTVLIGGIAAEVRFSGLAPWFAGANQINAIVPTIASGNVPLQVELGGIRTTDKITIAVDNNPAHTQQ